MRLVQGVLAIAGMVLLLHYGVVRVPGFGEATTLHPVHWEWHTGPALLGILCIAGALALIFTQRAD
jgi:ABC-type thiamin/hydroxymethylpyrimidine transport system permease subunit